MDKNGALRVIREECDRLDVGFALYPIHPGSALEAAPYSVFGSSGYTMFSSGLGVDIHLPVDKDCPTEAILATGFHELGHIERQWLTRLVTVERFRETYYANQFTLELDAWLYALDRLEPYGLTVDDPVVSHCIQWSLDSYRRAAREREGR